MNDKTDTDVTIDEIREAWTDERVRMAELLAEIAQRIVVSADAEPPEPSA